MGLVKWWSFFNFTVIFETFFSKVKDKNNKLELVIKIVSKELMFAYSDALKYLKYLIIVCTSHTSGF